MAGSTIYTKTLDRVVVVAGAIGGLTGRVFGGYKRFDDSQNLADLVRALTAGTQGYFFASLLNITTGEDQPWPFTIRGELLIRVPKDTTQDLNSAWDLAVSLSQALSLRENFEVADANVAMPSNCSFRFKGIENEIAYFDFGQYGGGGINFVDP